MVSTKCNVDAALFREEAADWAAVLGDWRGDLVECCTGYLGASLSPLLAESMVLREALSWLHSLAVDRVVIKSDSCLQIGWRIPLSRAALTRADFFQWDGIPRYLFANFV
ncbi:hypothetical protein GOBAR_AA02067 [Gossypium barbadense]|uniref:RNase H type-1 domain-containing protein n=1 Tax=Gossypium barbadense TaxID=3634 RepID=A0A2P5YSJ0_GOSBA|nr:hypothetical protein GOBAR_AA02067 [Gossypium barbadense]